MKHYPFLVTYWNCASGLVRKWDYIQSFVSEHEPDVFFISETEISVNSDRNWLSLVGYRTEFSKTLTSRGKSRLICFCKPFFERLPHLEGDLNEIIFLKKDKSIVCGLYRPFKCYGGETQFSNFERLINNLEVINDFGKRFSKVVVGDFNIHLNRNNCRMSKALECWSDDSNLVQIVDFQTRSREVGDTLQTSMIDLVFTNVNSLFCEGEFNSHSDHLILKVYDHSYEKDCRTKTTISYLDWRKYTRNAMRNLFTANFRGYNIRICSPDEINDRITSAIVKGLNQLVPKRETTVKGSNFVISPIIQNLKNKKSRIYKKWSKNRTLENLAELRKVSSKLNSEIRKERRRTIGSSLNKTSKQFWSTINKLMGRNLLSNIEIEKDGLPITDDGNIAEEFSKFFSDKVNNLARECNYEPEQADLQPSDQFVGYTLEDVEIAINHLKRSKAQGFDEVPGLVIKDLGDLLWEPLCWLFNSISENKNIPKAWKISKVIPVFKKGNSKSVNNYRPVSNVSSVCKVFERCLLNKLLTLGPSVLFGSHQHGFFPNRSTTTAMMTLQDFVSQSLDDNHSVLLYSADLSAAFDMLRSESLVANLTRLGVDHNLIALIDNYLRDRTSFVQIKNGYSNMREVPLGCVQGSVLGPSLFNIYTRELQDILPSSCFKLAYADDSYVGLICDQDNIDQKLMELSSIASRHFRWLESIGMVCNQSKTEFIIFDKYKRFKDKCLIMPMLNEVDILLIFYSFTALQFLVLVTPKSE